MDIRFMRTALALAGRGLGNVWPNPAVGCVIVRDGAIVGRGWTQPGGRPHAETEAVGRAGENARGATAYVSLEPCAHQGKTGPCVEALIGAGIARAVIAMRDPDPRVDGGGIERLREAGIEVETGVCASEAEELNAGFLMRVEHGRPLVTLKLATTLDGRIATSTGESMWITGEAARARAHGLRARHDAIMVGAGTAHADDPKLTCRLPGLGGRSPLRVVVDGAKPLPETHSLIADARDIATLVLVSASRAAERREAYEGHGVELLETDVDDDGNVDPGAAVRSLGDRGVTRLLVEGGARLAAALLRHGLADRMVWFRAPRVIGGDGLAAAAPFGVDTLDKSADFKLISVEEVGGDLMEYYRRS